MGSSSSSNVVVGVEVEEVEDDKFTFTVRPFLVGGAGPFVVVDVEGGFEEEVGELREPVKLRLRGS